MVSKKVAQRTGQHMPPRCNYCSKPAVAWFKYQGYLARAGRLPFRPWITVAACAEHKGCPNWESHIALHKPAKIEGAA